MASNVQIANWALAKIGADTITSFTEDSKEARAVNLLYDIVRDTVLRDHSWNFATKRATLASLVSTPDWGYAYEYQLPVDCLRIIGVQDDLIAYKIEGRKLVTDNADINIKYVYRVTDPNEFSPNFIDAFVTRLSAELSYLITQSNTVAGQMFDLYDKRLKEAKTLDAKEETPDQIQITPWLDARN